MLQTKINLLSCSKFAAFLVQIHNLMVYHYTLQKGNATIWISRTTLFESRPQQIVCCNRSTKSVVLDKLSSTKFKVCTHVRKKYSNRYLFHTHFAHHIIMINKWIDQLHKICPHLVEWASFVPVKRYNFFLKTKCSVYFAILQQSVKTHRSHGRDWMRTLSTTAADQQPMPTHTSNQWWIECSSATESPLDWA